MSTASPAARLDAWVRGLPARPPGRAFVERFVPPRRFAEKDFAGYRPDPAHPSQRAALERLAALADELREAREGGLLARLRAAFRDPSGPPGLYLDGGFGVGKTHLLAATWNAAPGPKAYLGFDELVYFVGSLGVADARAAFDGFRLVCVDEWELDDPGNLQLALAFLRGAVAAGARIVVTSNTVPTELGEGRFSQKDFKAEIEELASAFEVVRVTGEDYRHRHFDARPGREYLLDGRALAARARALGPRALLAPFDRLLAALAEVHPIRYMDLVDRIDALLVADLAPVPNLPHGLRWVHFVDKLYDAAVPLAAAGSIALGELFPEEFFAGAYAKKFSRCLSRLEELLGEGKKGLA